MSKQTKDAKLYMAGQAVLGIFILLLAPAGIPVLGKVVMGAILAGFILGEWMWLKLSEVLAAIDDGEY